MPRQLVVLHDSLGTLLMLGAAAFGVWGTLAFALRHQVDRRFRTGYLILTAVALAQLLLDLAFLLLEGRGRAGWSGVIVAAAGLLLLAIPYLLAARWSREGEAATLAVVCWLAAMVFGGGLAL